MAVRCMIGRKIGELSGRDRKRGMDAPCNPEECDKCGWNREEYERRKGIPLTKDENGLRHKNVARSEEEGTE